MFVFTFIPVEFSQNLDVLIVPIPLYYVRYFFFLMDFVYITLQW